MELDLSGRRALVTGSSSGIGAAIAKTFAEAGAAIAVHYNQNRQGAEETAKHIQKLPRQAVVLQGDVGREGDVEVILSKAVEALGGLDILVNNAGVTLEGKIMDMEISLWREILATNLDGPFLVTRAFLRQLKKQPQNPAMGEARGKIINITSVHQEIPLENAVAYCASKGGLLMFTRALALELAPEKVNVNAIAPGWIEVGRSGVVKVSKVGMTRFPWGRAGRPEEIAPLAIYLASSASDYVTGSAFVVDGGMRQSVGLV
jgi:glucose 1-dehydrogenase